MARIYWTPKSTFSVLSKSVAKGGKYYTFIAGTKYYGMPYTWIYDDKLPTMTSWSTWNSTGSFRIFNNQRTPVKLTSSEKETLKLDPNTTYYVKSFGNDCSTAVALAWKAGGASIEANYDTSTMLTKLKDGTSCIRKVGDYTTLKGSDTEAIVKNNTKTKIKDCYALLQQGDACFHDDSAGAHAILIYSNNTTTKQVTVIEQVGYWQTAYNNGQAYKSTWLYLKTYDYDTLANK